MADDVFEKEILPFLFDGIDEGQKRPEFVLLGGQTGAGKSRAIGRLLDSNRREMAVLRAADLAAFRRPGDRLDVVRGWMRDAIAHAREHRLSLVLEDSFRSSPEALAALRLFDAEGFRTRVVAPAISTAESLLAETARQIRLTGAMSAGGVGAIAGDIADDLEFTALVLASAPAGTEITVIGRDGRVIHSARGEDPSSTWRQARSVAMPSRAAAEWISELRRLTEPAQDRPRQTPISVIHALRELHRIALTEVLPSLPLPQGSPARDQMGARLRRDLAMLDSSSSTPVPEPVVGGTSSPTRASPSQ